MELLKCDEAGFIESIFVRNYFNNDLHNIISINISFDSNTVDVTKFI